MKKSLLLFTILLLAILNPMIALAQDDAPTIRFLIRGEWSSFDGSLLLIGYAETDEGETSGALYFRNLSWGGMVIWEFTSVPSCMTIVDENTLVLLAKGFSWTLSTQDSPEQLMRLIVFQARDEEPDRWIVVGSTAYGRTEEELSQECLHPEETIILTLDDWRGDEWKDPIDGSFSIEVNSASDD